MENEMTERVVAALEDALGGLFPHGMGPGDRYTIRDAARAAIEAIREPTEAMVRAASADMEAQASRHFDPYEFRLYDVDQASVFRAVIDVALAPPDPENDATRTLPDPMPEWRAEVFFRD